MGNFSNITNSGGSIIKNFWQYKKKQVKRTLFVPVFTFKTVQNSIELPLFGVIKIDVEGAELEVIQTLSEEIVKSKPIIIIEILSAYSENNILRFERQRLLLELIKKLNYKILRIIEDDKEMFKNIEKIEFFDVHSNPNNCNYILYPSDDEVRINMIFDSYFKPLR
jgi:hypothetical protein